MCGRAALWRRHRAQIRQYLGFQEATVQDAEALTRMVDRGGLAQPAGNECPNQAALYDGVANSGWNRRHRSGSNRILHSALRAADERF